MPKPEMLNENALFQRMLEEFVADNLDLQRLENELRKFNLFDCLKLVWLAGGPFKPFFGLSGAVSPQSLSQHLSTYRPQLTSPPFC
jgi:hypothetical protein